VTIPEYFQNRLRNEFGKTIDDVTKDNDNFQRNWNCTSEYDFLYGWHSGRTDWYFFTLFEKEFGRSPTEEEYGQMRDIIFSMSGQLREALNKRKK